MGEKIVYKKTLSVVLVFFLTLTIFTGCVEETDDENINDSISLDQIRLTLEDLNDEDYQEYGEVHVTEPYIAPLGTIFQGWEILEKYEIRYSKDASVFVIQSLAKLSSEQKADEFVDTIKTKDLSYNFTDITSTSYDIGEKFYLGINYTILLEEDSTLYMLVFKIKNIVVTLFSSNISEDDVINYGQTIEGNIEDKVL